MVTLPASHEDMAAVGLQGVPDPLPVSDRAAALATRLLGGGLGIDEAVEAVSRHLLAVSDADTVTGVLTAVPPDRPDAWVGLGGRAWLREWRRAPGNISVVPSPANPDDATSQPWLSALARRDGVVALADAAAMPVEVEVDRAETGRYGVAACLATTLIGDGPSYGSVSAVRGRPGLWAPEAIADLRLLGAALTARLEQVRSRRLLADALERGDRARSSARQFFSAVGHELRTPVAALLGTTEALAAEVGAAVEAAERDRPARPGDAGGAGGAAGVDVGLLTTVLADASAIRRAGEHLVSVVGELMTVGGAPSSTEVAWVDVAEAVRDVVHWLGVPATQARVRLEPRVPPGVQVRTTGTALRQVLANLLGNAVAYTDPGGRVVVDVTWSRGESDADWARVRVTDDGRGLTDAQAAEVFKPFVRFAPDRQGSGLGLAISRSLVERDGGLMGVTSAEGVGSTFWLELPGRQAGGCVASARAEVTR